MVKFLTTEEARLSSIVSNVEFFKHVNLIALLFCLINGNVC